MTKLEAGKSFSVFMVVTLIAALAAALVPASPALAQAGAWDIQTVDSTGDVGEFTSIALDSSNHPHISYFDNTNDDLKYARYDGAAWQIETVDSTGDVGEFTSLALDSSNHPHISYHDSSNGDLKYARWTGIAWAVETVDSTGQVGAYTSIALDSSNHPHISYYDGGNGDLKYARFVPAPTVTNVAPNQGTQGQTLSPVITGTNFTGASAVSFGTGITVNSFTVDSATQITTNITIAADATPGARDVSVTTPEGTGTLPDGFTVTAPLDVPDVAGEYSIKGSIRFFDWKCNKQPVIPGGTLYITEQEGHKVKGYWEPGVSIEGQPALVTVKGYVGPFVRDAKDKIKNTPRLSLVAELGDYCKYPDKTYVTYILNAAIKMDKKTELVKSMKGTINGWGEWGDPFPDDGSPKYGQFEGKFTATPPVPAP